MLVLLLPKLRGTAEVAGGEAGPSRSPTEAEVPLVGPGRYVSRRTRWYRQLPFLPLNGDRGLRLLPGCRGTRGTSRSRCRVLLEDPRGRPRLVRTPPLREGREGQGREGEGEEAVRSMAPSSPSEVGPARRVPAVHVLVAVCMRAPRPGCWCDVARLVEVAVERTRLLCVQMAALAEPGHLPRPAVCRGSSRAGLWEFMQSSVHRRVLPEGVAALLGVACRYKLSRRPVPVDQLGLPPVMHVVGACAGHQALAHRVVRGPQALGLDRAVAPVAGVALGGGLLLAAPSRTRDGGRSVTSVQATPRRSVCAALNDVRLVALLVAGQGSVVDRLGLLRFVFIESWRPTVPARPNPTRSRLGHYLVAVAGRAAARRSGVEVFSKNFRNAASWQVWQVGGVERLRLLLRERGQRARSGARARSRVSPPRAASVSTARASLAREAFIEASPRFLVRSSDTTGAARSRSMKRMIQPAAFIEARPRGAVPRGAACDVAGGAPPG